MTTVAGIFASREAASRGIQQLLASGVRDEAINVLAPGMAESQIASVPADDAEQPGMGTAIGAVVGGATGASIGLPIGAAIASMVIPGVGPIIAAGALGAAIFGVGGAAVGHSLEDKLTYGLSRDELFFYEEALRQGRVVVLVQAADDTEAESVRVTLEAAGAENIDAAREAWWIGLRDAEAQAYAARGGDFARDEPVYRRGFEAALLPFVRGRGFDDALADLDRMYPDICQTDAFRCGFERGSLYDETRRVRKDRAA
jgi:hypothetical protein